MDPVIVGTDGSAHADRAVAWAARHAVRIGRPLHIVFGAPRDAVALYPTGWTEHGEQILERASRLAQEWAPELEVSAELSAESPANALRTHAEKAAAIVIGHRGHDGFTGLLLGSVGLRLAGHVPAPVVVVRGEPTISHGEIMVGIDGFDVCEPALEYACQTALAWGAKLSVIEIWEVPSSLWNGAYPTIIRRSLNDAQHRLGEIVAPWREKFPGLELDHQVIPGHPVGTLADLSGSRDLLVVGSRGYGSVHAAFAGSVSHGVMHYARCPVAVLAPSPAWTKGPGAR